LLNSRVKLLLQLGAHSCNPSYSGGRDQEDCSSKPVWANSLRDPISKQLITKRSGGVAQGIGPEFKSQYQKKSIMLFIIYVNFNLCVCVCVYKEKSTEEFSSILWL
jgi:hypothetical protein